jgi:hypothetical protein
MSTVSAGDVLAERLAQFKQKQQGLSETARIIEPVTIQPLIVRPNASSWDELEQKLDKVINLPGLWITVRKLYEAGQGAALETAAEIALAKARKSPFNMFAVMVSKKSGNWVKRTLKKVEETWEVRRSALEVIDKLKLKADSVKAILAIAWRLKGSLARYLALATEQGTGIKNPIGLFFALTKKPKPATI